MGTALVTGATSGIGLALARELAVGHHDLVLVARSTERLQEAAHELHQRAGVGVQVLTADLSTPEGRERVAERLRVGLPDGVRSSAPQVSRPHTEQDVARRPVDLLVNNAGFAVGQELVGGDLAQERRALDVMVAAVLELTHAAVPGMVARGHGAVLNVASVTALTAMGTYAAHKAWVRTFTEALASELRGSGVSATVLNPGLTRSDFHHRAGIAEESWPGPAWLDADDVAREALAAVRRGQVICTPSARYRAVNALLRVSPRWLVRRVAGHATARTRY
ncbi:MULTISPECIES: SDR family oxidoreductase [unclassified Actinomyces]|uniref:SDR family NAD(P)-dependent oxidoreductase n=1 Tax=unclassified Actinomyces TaxID=2609248 RepID=UPI002016F81F|nr:MULTISPECIES: SDR family oxidoreductase [unclassified Actinomyces]MCL3777779.1 SDR family oxidoreductase [Actinomyces sp. AC-20-1]MCL3789459.1 SDR family oxidoreductase [Actinomyces sp. 187325]MCL3791762.1 SDR family oxidoreductase [Actinomyces sp. 186855]MCL3794852.1 SDR family oxidoreductase [Actinomyces sp. 217892]